MWEQIKDNQIRSAVLITTMGILLLMIGFVIGYAFFGDPISGLVIAALVWGIMNLVALFQGDSIILGMSGAKKIDPDDHPRLYNVVEEMKIASGLQKMPDIYVIDDPALNAFSTGRSPDHASVAITSGLLDKLNRDELQLVHYLLNFVSNERVLLMIVMVGQPELAEKIARFPSLRSRLVSSSVTEMTREDMERMIRFRWTVAAGDPTATVPFSPEAYETLYQISKGNPRLVCKLCYNALLQGYLQQVRLITPEIVTKANQEL